MALKKKNLAPTPVEETAPKSPLVKKKVVSTTEETPAPKEVKKPLKKAKPTNTEELIEKAKENTTVVIKDGVNQTETFIKSGVAEDTKLSKNTNLNDTIVGLGKGLTKNMGNYQTLRVDCWISTKVETGESIESTINEISTILDNVLTDEVNALIDDSKN